MLLLGYSTGHIVRDIVEGAARHAVMWLFRKVACASGCHHYRDARGFVAKRCRDCGERLS